MIELLSVEVNPPGVDFDAIGFVIKHADVFAVLIVVAVIAAIMRHRPARMVVLGIAIALAGVWLVRVVR